MLTQGLVKAANYAQCSTVYKSDSIFLILVIILEVLQGMTMLFGFLFIGPIVLVFLGILVYSFTTACHAKEMQELAPWKFLFLTLTLHFRGCHFPNIFLSITTLQWWIQKLPWNVCSGWGHFPVALRKTKAVVITFFSCWCLPSFLLLDQMFVQLTLFFFFW